MFKLSRRKFIKYLGQSSAVLGIGLSQSSLSQTGGSKTVIKESSGKYPDLEINTDIAIVGGGGGGLIAAVAAAEKGAKVVVLEKREVLQNVHLHFHKE